MNYSYEINEIKLLRTKVCYNEMSWFRHVFKGKRQLMFVKRYYDLDIIKLSRRNFKKDVEPLLYLTPQKFRLYWAYINSMELFINDIRISLECFFRFIIIFLKI